MAQYRQGLGEKVVGLKPVCMCMYACTLCIFQMCRTYVVYLIRTNVLYCMRVNTEHTLL